MLPRPPPVPGRDDSPHHEGDAVEARWSLPRTRYGIEKEGPTAGPGEPRPSDEQDHRHRDGSPFVPPDEAADPARESLDAREYLLAKSGWRCSAVRRRTHYAPGLESQRKRIGGGWRKTQFAQGLIQRVKQPLRRRTHYALGLAPQRRTPVWGLEQNAIRPGCYSGGTQTLEVATKGDERGNAVRPGRHSWDSCHVGEMEGNAVRPTATSSATGPMETALQRQASGLTLLSDRSVLKRRCRYCRSVAMPQPYGSGRS